MITPEEHLCTANPEADPDEIARFVFALGSRGLLIVPPGETVPVGYVMLSQGEVIRQTDPVVWSRPPRTAVALVWNGAQVYAREVDDDTDA